MKQLICFAFIILQVSVSVYANGYYTIVAPGTIQSETDYEVTITVHDNHEAATIKVGISGPSYNESKIIEIQPFGAEIVAFDVPPLDEGTYELQTEGLSGLIFKRYSKLNYKNNVPKVYIQTDKATYKPGDVVQYRILALDENTKPAKTKVPLTLSIQDGVSNKIKKVRDIQFVKGVHSGKFKLSDQPVLGLWTIEITAGKANNFKAKKTFDVDKYVLPKFSVEIDADKMVAILDKTFKIKVRSKYTHGKPVKGNVTVTAKFQANHYPTTLSGAQKSADIDGTAEVEFNLMDDLNMEEIRNNLLPQIEVMAVVNEAYTSLQQNASTTISVVRSRYTIAIENMAHEYEVNKPFEIKATIKKLNGSPVRNAKSTAKLIIGQSHSSHIGYGGYGSPVWTSHQPIYPGTRPPTWPQIDPSDRENDLMFETEVDKNGMATFKLKFKTIGQFSHVKVMFEEKIYSTRGFNVRSQKLTAPNEIAGTPVNAGVVGGPMMQYYPQPIGHVGPLKLFPKTTDPKLGEEIFIDVKSDDPIKYFVYTVMVRGKIIKHEYVKLDGDKKCHCIKIKPTFEMAPEAKIFVYFVDDGELRYDETTIRIPNRFENKLKITAPEQTKPSDHVTLNIQTDPDSFVGLLAVDQSVLLLKEGNDLDESTIYNDLKSYISLAPPSNGRHNTYPGKSGGFVTLTNACYPRHASYPEYPRGFPGSMAGSMGVGYSGGLQAAPAAGYGPGMAMSSSTSVPGIFAVQPQIRKNFVETWIFDDIESTDSNGIANFTKKIPDTITSWVITGFSLNEKTGFAMTQDSTKVRTFQPFFISLNLPYSVKRGEVVAIPVVVFNYMDTTLNAAITMDNSDEEFSFTEAFTDVQDKILNEKQMTKKLSVPSNSGATVSFLILPRELGDITLKIKAITLVAGDEIHQKLKVEPEGITQYKNDAFFVNIPPHGESVKHTFQADIPNDVVLGSEFLELAVVSDLLGPTVENIDRLVRLPYGCGEQNMINFVPNILVLEYLDVIKLDKPSLVEKAKNYMESGYQRELTYKHRDGSFSTFGEGHSEANSWLTAYVARSFIQARKFIAIDGNVIEQALQYLIKTQQHNGQFQRTGSRYNTNANDVGITAYILLTLVEDTIYALQYKSQVENALQYLANNVEREDDVHTLALIALVFQKVKHPEAQRLLERLEYKANNENNLKWWSKSSQSYSNNDIEITAYIFQALAETETDDNKLLPIIKWLIKQRNSLGGFHSTQDTVVGLQALIKFAEKYATGSGSGFGKIDIKYVAHDGEGNETASSSMSLDKEYGLDLIAREFSRSTRQLTVTAEGDGTVLIQFSYHYNLAALHDKSGFRIKYSQTPVVYPGQLVMNVCAEYQPQPDDEINESNMAVMEIYLPSGYTTHDDSLNHIRNVAQVQRVETKNDDTVIIAYFDSLVGGEPVCFDVLAEKYHNVAKLKPAAITVYDYYNSQQRATVFYEVKSSLCDICEKEQCGKGCKTR